MLQLTGSYRSARQRTSRSRTVNSDVKGCESGEGEEARSERGQGAKTGVRESTAGHLTLAPVAASDGEA